MSMTFGWSLVAKFPTASALDPVCVEWTENEDGVLVCTAYSGGSDATRPVVVAPPANGNGGGNGGGNGSGGVQRDGWCDDRRPAPEQPPAGADIWQGRDPETHTVMRCYWFNQRGPDGLPYIDYVVADGEPDNGPAADPAVLAQSAVGRLSLAPIRVGIAPEASASSLGLVGLPVWMWVDSPDATTFGPASLSISAGPVSVSLTAAVERVEWDMGDGSVVSCTSPGTPYDPSRGAQPSPDCGHVYTTTSAGQPGEAFTVTATSYWVANWSSNTGAAGTIELQQTATEQVRIGESQVIITRD
jgi:hypothetical protein